MGACEHVSGHKPLYSFENALRFQGLGFIANLHLLAQALSLVLTPPCSAPISLP
jgi:hypothetical protein